MLYLCSYVISVCSHIISVCRHVISVRSHIIHVRSHVISVRSHVISVFTYYVCVFTYYICVFICYICVHMLYLCVHMLYLCVHVLYLCVHMLYLCVHMYLCVRMLYLCVHMLYMCVHIFYLCVHILYLCVHMLYLCVYILYLCSHVISVFSPNHRSDCTHILVLRVYDFAHSPDLWHQPKLANVTAPKAGVFVELLFLYVVGIFHLLLEVFVEWCLSKATFPCTLLPRNLPLAVDDILMWTSVPAGLASYLVYQTVWFIQHDGAAVGSLDRTGEVPVWHLLHITAIFSNCVVLFKLVSFNSRITKTRCNFF